MGSEPTAAEIQAATSELNEATAPASAPLAEVLPAPGTGRLSRAHRVPVGWSGSGGRSGGAADLKEFSQRGWVSPQRALVSDPY